MSETEEGQSLDDFFAKKSKSKKSKNKGKAFTTSKDIAEKKQKKKDKTEEATETAPKEVSEVGMDAVYFKPASLNSRYQKVTLACLL